MTMKIILIILRITKWMVYLVLSEQSFFLQGVFLCLLVGMLQLYIFSKWQLIVVYIYLFSHYYYFYKSQAMNIPNTLSSSYFVHNNFVRERETSPNSPSWLSFNQIGSLLIHDQIWLHGSWIIWIKC